MTTHKTVAAPTAPPALKEVLESLLQKSPQLMAAIETFSDAYSYLANKRPTQEAMIQALKDTGMDYTGAYNITMRMSESPAVVAAFLDKPIVSLYDRTIGDSTCTAWPAILEPASGADRWSKPLYACTTIQGAPSGVAREKPVWGRVKKSTQRVRISYVESIVSPIPKALEPYLEANEKLSATVQWFIKDFLMSRTQSEFQERLVHECIEAGIDATSAYAFFVEMGDNLRAARKGKSPSV